MRMLLVRLSLAAALLVAALGVMVPASAGKTQATPTPVPEVCIHVSPEVGVACSSYLGHAHLALQPYYKFVNAGRLRHKFVSRLLIESYGPRARATLALWAKQYGHPIPGWPAGTNAVPVGPTIIITKAFAHPKCNKTLLVTRETWVIMGGNTKILYKENNQVRTVVLGGPGQLFKVLAIAKGQDLNLAGC